MRAAAAWIIAAGSGLVLACGTAKNATGDDRFGGTTPGDSLFFSLERTPCFGRCPAYTVAVYRSGLATFDGRSNTPLIGAHRAQAGRELMEAILAGAERAGFFTMQDSYDGQVTDLPSTIVRVVSGGRDKKVVGRYRMPEAFKHFAQSADSLLLPLDWKAAGVR